MRKINMFKINTCCVCHNKNNELTLTCSRCDKCFHEKCHNPNIEPYNLELGITFKCTRCVLSAKLRKFKIKKNPAIVPKIKSMTNSLPYDLSLLTWNSEHFTNEQNVYCYCGSPGVYYEKMLQCRKCLQWFHEGCISSLKTPLLYGDHYFKFKCAVCNNGKEYLKRIEYEIVDLIAIALNTLALTHLKGYFSLTKEILPIVRKNVHVLLSKTEVQVMDDEKLTERLEMILHSNSDKFVRSNRLWALRMNPKKETFVFGHYVKCKVVENIKEDPLMMNVDDVAMEVVIGKHEEQNTSDSINNGNGIDFEVNKSLTANLFNSETQNSEPVILTTDTISPSIINSNEISEGHKRDTKIESNFLPFCELLKKNRERHIEMMNTLKKFEHLRMINKMNTKPKQVMIQNSRKPFLLKEPKPPKRRKVSCTKTYVTLEEIFP
ncbi:metal-response element-binding transcription factor 2-like isoform X1, partial [Leptotrombidium deliense]